MIKKVTCPIDKVKELILEAYPKYYKVDECVQEKIVGEFVKPIHQKTMLNFMEIKQITNEEADKIIENRKPLGQFYTPESGKYIGIDNQNGQAWVEEFGNIEDCLDWLCDE